MKRNFLRYLSLAINAYLKLDQESNRRLKKLRGKIITIELLPFHLVFHCEFRDNEVVLQETITSTPNTVIRGTPMQMLNVMLTIENRQQFFADDMVIEGDAEIGQQVIALFDELRIDWEEHLSSVTGDVPAYHISRIVHGVKKWFVNSGNTLAQNLNEYMHEEKNWVPAQEALQDFFNDIDVLRMDVDRAEAKIKQLHNMFRDGDAE